MKKIEQISASILLKRRTDLDSEVFPLSDLSLSTYDIRKNRVRNPKLKEDLKRDNQLQPITINVKTDGSKLIKLEDALLFIVVNGRTRKVEMDELFTETGIFANVSVVVYENLTELEENYLNAQINISQHPLTSDEKREFIVKYKNEIPIKEMAKALGLGMEMFKNYIATTEVDDKVLKEWLPKSKGHGRGDIKVEELGKSIRAYKRTNPNVDKKTLNKTFKKLGSLSAKMAATRDEKRQEFPKIVERVAKLQTNPLLTKKYDINTLIKGASKEVSNTNGSSGDKLPVNSSKKYKIIDDLLKDKYDFALLLFAEGLYRDDKGTQIESETKRIIDSVDEIIAVGNELAKLSEIEDYVKSLGKKIIIYNDDVLDACDTLLKDDKRKGFVYVNGASLFAQRPQFMNYLKAKYPKSIIGMVFLDLLFGQNQVYRGATLRERITVYGGVNSFDDVISKFKSLVKFSKFRKYSDAPNEKYIVIV